jgi:hypothetical protein
VKRRATYNCSPTFVQLCVQRRPRHSALVKALRAAFGGVLRAALTRAHAVAWAQLCQRRKVLLWQVNERTSYRDVSFCLTESPDTGVRQILVWELVGTAAVRGRPARSQSAERPVTIAQLTGRPSQPEAVSILRLGPSDSSSESAPRGILLVLVPPARTNNATDVVKGEFGLDGAGPWRAKDYPDVAIAVISCGRLQRGRWT